MLVDGARRGADIARAVARGADFGFAGRSMLYGAAGAEAGAARALEILVGGLDSTTALLGCTTVGELRDIAGVRLAGHERARSA